MRTKALVIGDIMIDKYIIGKTKRISPEAPVPVLLIDKMYNKLGGAANVANNLVCNGVKTDIIGLLGNDEDGLCTIELLKKADIGYKNIFMDSNRPTTVKCRCLGQNNQQILRLDTENSNSILAETADYLLELIKKNINNYAIVILSDYLKGLLTPYFTKEVINIANEHNIPVLADIKDINFNKYSNSFLLKPNKLELCTIMGSASTKKELIEAGQRLREKASVKYVLTTLGADGMMLIGENNLVSFIESEAKEVYDVTGAGDTVIAFLALGLLKGMEILDAVNFSNVAAGVKVSKLGSSAISEFEVLKAQKGINKKILEISELDFIDRKNKKIVFTNGCFDVLHLGHISSLQSAKKLGDILIVGLNSDNSVRKLKGSERPYNNEVARATLLAALEYVDYVCIFDDETPYELIKKIRPDILVKGKDYQDKEVVGSDIIKIYGGEVILIDLIDGISSTKLINKITKIK